MIHEKQVKDPDTGEYRTEYTSDREDCKVVIVDGKPVERKMEMGERRNRRDGQTIGKTKQRGITKRRKKLEREKENRMSVIGRDIEERIGEYVERMITDTEIEKKLTKSQGSVLDRINSFLKEKEEPVDDEEEDDEDIKINTDPSAIDKLDPEEKKKVLELKAKIEANADQLSLDDEGDEEEPVDDEEPTDDEEPEEEPVEDEEPEEEPVDDEEPPDDEEPEEEPTDDKEPEEEPEGGNLNGEEGEEEEIDEIDAENEFATITKDNDYNIDTNNAYEYYEFLISKMDDEAMITKLNTAYIKIPKDKRKIVVARELLGNINDTMDAEESGGGDDAFGGEGGEDVGF